MALAFLLDDPSIDYANFGMNTPVAAWLKSMGNVAFNFMLPILAGFIAMSIADRPGLMVGFAGGAFFFRNRFTNEERKSGMSYYFRWHTRPCVK